MALTQEQLVQPDVVVYCETELDAKQLFHWAHSQNLTWYSGDSYASFQPYVQGGRCYYLYEGWHGSIENYEKRNFIVIPFAAIQ